MLMFERYRQEAAKPVSRPISARNTSVLGIGISARMQVRVLLPV